MVYFLIQFEHMVFFGKYFGHMVFLKNKRRIAMRRYGINQIMHKGAAYGYTPNVFPKNALLFNPP